MSRWTSEIINPDYDPGRNRYTSPSTSASMSSSTASISTPTRHRFEKLVEDNKPSKMYVLYFLTFFHSLYDVPITSWESLREITHVENNLT